MVIAINSKICINCFKPSEGNYATHLTDEACGPEFNLCDGCGGNLKPTIKDIQKNIHARFIVKNETTFKEGKYSFIKEFGDENL